MQNSMLNLDMLWEAYLMRKKNRKLKRTNKNQNTRSIHAYNGYLCKLSHSVSYVKVIAVYACWLTVIWFSVGLCDSNVVHRCIYAYDASDGFVTTLKSFISWFFQFQSLASNYAIYSKQKWRWKQQEKNQNKKKHC